MCAVLVALGTLTDWGLRKRHKEAILAGLRRFEDKLGHAPIRDWQIAVAGSVVRFWSALGRAPYIVFGKAGAALWETRLGKATEEFTQDGQSWYHREAGWAMLHAILLIQLAPFALLLLIVILGVLESWFLLALCVPGVLYVALVPAMWALAIADIAEVKAIDYLVEKVVGDWLVEAIPHACLISAVFSILATFAGLGMGAGHAGSYWFERASDTLAPTHPILLTALNFPFDLATILISIKLLKWVVSKGKWIVLIAVIDIIISAALVILLHTTLKVIETGSVTAIGHHFAESWSWFVCVVTFDASRAHPDWPLTPVLLTTFIPVAAYMLAFVFLGIVVRPFARIAAYICGLLGEKEKTPFAELAVIISLLGAAAKALSEWSWLKHVLSGS